MSTANLQTGNGQVIITVLCAGLTTSVSSSTVCDGEQVTLSATSTNGGNITWDNGVVDGVAFTPPAGTTTTYIATSDDAGDCSFSVDITSNALPTVVATADTTAVCFGGQVTLTGTGADSYVWDNGATDGVPTTPASGTTNYQVTGTDSGTGCENTDMIAIMASNPTASFSITHEVAGNDGAINLTVLNGVAPFVFDWDIDGLGDNDDTEDLSGLTAGIYSVIITDDLGCTEVANATVYNVVGIAVDDFKFEIYPNPANDIVNIKANGIFEYSIFDLSEKLILKGKANSTETIELADLESGVYFVQIKSGLTDVTSKLIKR